VDLQHGKAHLHEHFGGQLRESRCDEEDDDLEPVHLEAAAAAAVATATTTATASTLTRMTTRKGRG
jgi:hypothetical protein